MEGQKVLGQVLSKVSTCRSEGRGDREPYRFIPVNGNASAVDIGGIAVLKVLETRVSRFLKNVSWKFGFST